jgi:hypothetical protein
MQEYYARRIIQIRCGIHTTVYMRDYAGTSVGEVNYSLFRCLLRSLLLRFSLRQRGKKDALHLEGQFTTVDTLPAKSGYHQLIGLIGAM